ncbi:hypothetical protein JW930_03410 [Candidatus Woesearchaeota archaeon]|nr:hypothetical protein [Candidatus Woesearchaeota archaeon]
MLKKVCLFLVLVLILPLVTAKSAHMKLLAVAEYGEEETGSSADLYLEVKQGTGRIYIDTFPLTKLDTQISTRFANEIACDFLSKNCKNLDFFYTIRANSPIVGGPSASAAIAVLTISVLDNINLEEGATITGTINSGGIIGPVGGIISKLEEASRLNLTKVLIPRWSNINDTNISSVALGENTKIVKVSSLKEALFELTGKDYGTEGNLIISSSYQETMQNISHSLCERTSSLATHYNTANEKDAYDLYKQGNESLLMNQYYSAASYCFGANVKFHYEKLLHENITVKEIVEKANLFKNKTDEYEGTIKNKKITTLVELQTFAVVNERLLDARDFFIEASENFNDTNASLYNLAFGIERLNSAFSWSKFFNVDGKQYNLDKASLAKSCLNKIAEAEERKQYAVLYLPLLPDKINRQIDYAYKNYNKGYYDLCLHRASIAKADIDLILDTIAITEEHIPSLIDERLKIAESMIARQDRKGVFPILGYSYYEYANSLKESDPYSALLYLEYAFELSNLDIYFERKEVHIPEIKSEYIIIFVAGIAFGFVLGFIWMKNNFIRG